MSRSSQRPHTGAKAHRSTPVTGALRGRPASKKPAQVATTKSDTSAKVAPNKQQRSLKKIPDPFIPGPTKKGRRICVSYDLEGPRVRLGILWFIAVFGSLALGRAASDFPLIGVLFGATAAVSALQITDAWIHQPRSVVLRTTAALIALGVTVSAMFGAKVLGGALIAAIAAALLSSLSQATRHRNAAASVALVLQASLPVGVVGASLVLVTRYEIGAAVILLATALAFDVGDFLVGSGAGTLGEGPIAGAIMIALVGATAAILGAPPFHGALAWAFAGGAIVLCPLGQIVASSLLPDATTRASALRRLDSLLLLAPCWAIAAGIVAANA